ncbi:hypothetical protein D3C73_854560 [compost metagenome]
MSGHYRFFNDSVSGLQSRFSDHTIGSYLQSAACADDAVRFYVLFVASARQFPGEQEAEPHAVNSAHLCRVHRTVCTLLGTGLADTARADPEFHRQYSLSGAGDAGSVQQAAKRPLLFPLLQGGCRSVSTDIGLLERYYHLGDQFHVQSDQCGIKHCSGHCYSAYYSLLHAEGWT